MWPGRDIILERIEHTILVIKQAGTFFYLLRSGNKLRNHANYFILYRFPPIYILTRASKLVRNTPCVYKFLPNQHDSFLSVFHLSQREARS